MNIKKTKYKDIEALELDCGDVVFKVIPKSGMKIASAIDKKSGFEFLHQNVKGLKKFIRPEYGKDFVEYETAGFDDMLPTIDPYYAEYPWDGVFIPNHGEVWCQQYKIEELTDKSVTASVTGIRMPYTLTKKFTSDKSNVLHVEYTLKNPTKFDMDYIWAGHCMLNAQVGSRFITPDECKTGICIITDNDRIGKYGDKFNYPINTDKNGITHDMSVMRDGSVCADEKYYFAERLTKDGFLGVTYPENNLKYVMHFPTDVVPYVGILNDECGWDGMYLCILEPCTAPYDRPDLAKMHGYDKSVIKAGEELRWYVDVEISEI